MTVKPVELMRHLVRLVTPPGGTVLDPFAGSGSTLIAAEQEGFQWIGIEKEAEYVQIIEARLNGTQRGLGLEIVERTFDSCDNGDTANEAVNIRISDGPASVLIPPGRGRSRTRGMRP